MILFLQTSLLVVSIAPNLEQIIADERLLRDRRFCT